MTWQCLEHKSTNAGGNFTLTTLDSANNIECIAAAQNATTCTWFSTLAECQSVDPATMSTLICANYQSGWCQDFYAQLNNMTTVQPSYNSTSVMSPLLTSNWSCTTYMSGRVTIAMINGTSGVECVGAPSKTNDCVWFGTMRECWNEGGNVLNDTNLKPLSCATILNTTTATLSASYKWCDSILQAFSNNTSDNKTINASSGSTTLSLTTILLIVLVCVVFCASVAVFLMMRKQYNRSFSSSSFFDSSKHIEYLQSDHTFNMPRESLVHDDVPPAIVNRPRDFVLANSFESVSNSSNETPRIGNDTVLGICLDMGDLALWRLDETQLVPIKTLATGASGIVALGTYKQTQHVAIKKQLGEITPESVQAFIDEIKLSSRLDSPYIVRFIGASWVRPRNIEMVVEYMEGGDLREYLKSQPVLLVGWQKYKLQIAMDVMDGLLYLHSMDIIHRDLKARNVLLKANLRAKLTDFGVSRQVSDHGTMTMGVGTFRWAAPEVFRDNKYTVAADIYSFGMLLVELATHDIPYAEHSELSNFALMQVLKDAKSRFPPYTSNQNCPDYIHELIAACINDDPKQRPSAMEINARLREQQQPKIGSPFAF
ncbi:kinase [Thraustotheca clavata]|uniref:Kinase n=1 Tax=Thraustotheca clavata TaxID=74557 RepID=A0A1W0A7T9_9STRA|nr:kinase [Thraustotheca clavata]